MSGTTANHDDSPSRTFTGLDELLAAVGDDLGSGPWFDVEQDRISAFADVTGDHQWIHVDPARASSGPFGTTIAHGFLTLSLIPRLSREIFVIDGFSMAINYGLERTRFPQPVLEGDRIRCRAALKSVTDTERGVRVVVRYTVEIKGRSKPACVTEAVRLLIP